MTRNADAYKRNTKSRYLTENEKNIVNFDVINKSKTEPIKAK